MRKLVTIALTIALVGLAAPALAHSGGPKNHKTCTGATDWESNGASTYSVSIADTYLAFYAFRGEEDSEYEGATPGILWMESNDFNQENGYTTDLQTTNFKCQDPEQGSDDFVVHSDTVII